MKKYIVLLFILLSLFSCISQNSNNDKRTRLKTVFSKDKWLRSLKQLERKDIINLTEYTDSQIYELYKTIIDSACVYFSDSEINQIIECRNKNLKVKKDLNDKLMQFVSVSGKIGGQWAANICINNMGYDYSEGVIEYYKFDFESSLKYFETQINEKKNYTYTNFLFLGKSFLALQKYENAIEAFKKAIEVNPKNYESYCNLAKAYLFGLNDTNSAKNAINLALNHEPTNVECILTLGDIYCGSNDFENGIKTYSIILNSNNKCIDALNSRGLANLYSGNSEKALRDFQNTLKIDSINKEALLGMCSIYMKQPIFDSAKYFLNIVIKNYSKDNIGFSYMGNCNLLQKNYSEAIKNYNKSIELKPNFVDVNYRGYSYCEIGDYGKAKKDFQYVICCANKNNDKLNLGSAYSFLGYAEYKQSKYHIALSHIDTSLTFFPENSWAYRNKALILIKMNLKSKACEALEKAKILKFYDYYGNEVNDLIKENCR